MNDFEAALQKFTEESLEIQKQEQELTIKTALFNQKFSGFLKEAGLPDNFTLPELGSLVARKVKA